MNALTVDDEKLMLNALSAAVKASPDIDAVTEFSSCSAALEWARENTADIAFLDISMRGMGGLALAEKLLELQPKMKIIFCTGHSEYAVDAFRIHVSGYLMKPITPDAVQREIDHIKSESGAKKLLTIRCFGTFDVFADGKPLVFKRSIAKEILAVLTDRCGAGITSKQICAVIRPENSDEDKNMNYIRQGFRDLRKTLDSVGAADILVHSGIHSYSLNTDLIDCDYYSYTQCGEPLFRGEYMKQYSWAEETVALLWGRER
ncbi:MAG: LytR/AlgR family response regulator transcription factor [Oscillospiraceae bacterium]